MKGFINYLIKSDDGVYELLMVYMAHLLIIYGFSIYTSNIVTLDMIYTLINIPATIIILVKYYIRYKNR